MAELSLEKLLLHYAQCGRAEGKSRKTEAWYNYMYMGSRFIHFLAETGRKPILANFHLTTVREFLVHQQEKRLSPSTVQGNAKSLKAWASWLHAEGYTSANLLVGLKVPKVPTKIVQPLTSGEIEALMSCRNPLTALGCRDLSILATLLATGIRRAELTSLRFEEAHIEDGYIKVMGKGGKERVVPIGALAQKILWRYVFHFRPQPVIESDNYLFLTTDGRALKPNAIRLLLKRWGRKAGVPRLHPHLCRHTYATNFLVYGCGDVFMLKQILGHSKLDMVERYVHWASVENMIQKRVASPLDHLGIKRLKGYQVDRQLKTGRKPCPVDASLWQGPDFTSAHPHSASRGNVSGTQEGLSAKSFSPPSFWLLRTRA